MEGIHGLPLPLNNKKCCFQMNYRVVLGVSNCNIWGKGWGGGGRVMRYGFSFRLSYQPRPVEAKKNSCFRNENLQDSRL